MPTGKSRYIYVVSGTLVLLLAGVIYAWSILNAPFQTEFGWSAGALGLNFTLTMGAFCAGLILGGFLLKRMSLRVIMILSGVMVCAGFGITGMMSGEHIIVLYLAYAVLCGLGIGTVYNALISSIMGWFPDKRATVSGVLMMGFGASTLVFGFVANAIMAAVGWRNMYIGIGLTMFLVFSLCSFFIKAYVPSKQNVAQKDAEKKQNKPENTDYTSKELLRKSSFWRFYGFEIFIAAVGACVISMARDMAMYVSIAEQTAVMLVGVSAVSNGVGRIVAGIFFDKKGGLFTMRFVGVVALVTPLLMLLSSVFSMPALFVPGIMLAGFSYGFTPVLASGFIGKTYGMKNFPLNFSVASTFLFIASFSATIGGWLYGMAGGFHAVFLFMIVLAVLAIIMGETLKKVARGK